MWLIDYAQNTENEVLTVVGESVPHLNLGAKRDFKNIMVANRYWKEGSWTESGVYTFEKGSIIEFISFDKFGKAHGPRRDVLFLNEANYLPYDIADQLITRTRKVVWLDWNPSSDFWFYEEVLGKQDIDFFGEGGNFPPLTYKDNEALDQASIDRIEAHTNPSWRKVYIDGKRGEIEGIIYPTWKEVDEIPMGARLERAWTDFGYTNDPTAIGELWYYNGAYYLDEVAYLKGLSNKQIADILLNRPQRALVIADSAEPKSIDEIASYGVQIMATTKGKDSVKHGIQQVQEQVIFITKRSRNIIKERRNYIWLTDKDGRSLNEPTPIWNHHMDGIRYAITSLVPIIRHQEYVDSMPRYSQKQQINRAR